MSHAKVLHLLGSVRSLLAGARQGSRRGRKGVGTRTEARTRRGAGPTVLNIGVGSSVLRVNDPGRLYSRGGLG